MRILSNGEVIGTLDDWRRLAPPKSEHHWVEGRSAMELARAWCGSGAPAMPVEVKTLLGSVEVTANLQVEEVYPEHRISFDAHGGEPRNADLAFIGVARGLKVAVTIEAKADEPFGDTVAGTLSAALERVIETPASRGIQRVSDLVRSLFRRREKGQPAVATLRYQLLTAAAGTVAFARQHEADVAVLIVHEFITQQTRDAAHAQNLRDFSDFLSRLSGAAVEAGQPRLWGPYSVPGTPLFDTVPALYVGKTATNCRRDSSA